MEIKLAIIILSMSILSYIMYLYLNNLFHYSKIYDDLLNKLMDNNTPIVLSNMTAQFEGTKFIVWIANYPYAYGSLYIEGILLYPSMKTRKRLAEYIIKQLYTSF